jgi:hypothetical protein
LSREATALNVLFLRQPANVFCRNYVAARPQNRYAFFILEDAIVVKGRLSAASYVASQHVRDEASCRCSLSTNSTDGVIGGNLSRVLPYLFTTRLVNNQYLQAVKTIGIRTTPTTCNA